MSLIKSAGGLIQRTLGRKDIHIGNVVAASFTHAAATVAINNQSLPWDTTTFDPYGGQSGGAGDWAWTVPVSGYYQINAKFSYAPLAWTVGKFYYISVAGGIGPAYGPIIGVDTAASIYRSCSYSSIKYYKAGEKLWTTINHNNPSNPTFAGVSFNSLDIHRIGIGDNS